MDDLASSIRLLKLKYPFESIFLTYIPLNDMAHLLNEDGSLTQLVADGAAPPEIFQSLKAFLASKRAPEMKHSIAFVQLELNTGKAGFKKISDRDGVIYPIAWSQDAVLRIAKFSDAFLDRLFAFEKKHSYIAAGDLPLDIGWVTWKSLKADPYIPMARKMALDLDWRMLVNQKSGELMDLKSKNPVVYDAIQTFSINYDRSLLALTSEKALEPLRIKSMELDDAVENFKTKHNDYIACLHSKKVEDSLKIGMLQFENTEFSLEAQVNDDFSQIYQGITGGASLAKILTQRGFGFSHEESKRDGGTIKGFSDLDLGGGRGRF